MAAHDAHHQAAAGPGIAEVERVARRQHGIVEVCSEAGYELLVHPVSVDDACLTDNLRDFVRRTQVDGLILLSPVSTVAAVPSLLAELGVPAVSIAAIPVPGYQAMLLTDERAAARNVTDHLVALGHRRVATITGPRRFASAGERERGFRDGLEAAGIALPPAYVSEGDYSFDSGLAAAGALLTLPDPPTAIFAANDIMAAAALKVARERGLDVPGDLSVAGFDDSDIAAMVTPALTTIRRPLRDLAREATRRLIALVEGEAGTPADHRIELDLVVRDSTGPLRR